MYTVVLRRWIEDEVRNSYSAIFHSPDLDEAKLAVSKYANAEWYDIIMVVHTEHATKPEENSIYVFAVGDEIKRPETLIDCGDELYLNVMHSWEDDNLPAKIRMDLCCYGMEEKEFLKLVVSLIIPFVDIISKDRLGSIVSYKKLLEYIN